MNHPRFTQRATESMLFVEGFRLLSVLAGSVAGYEVGQSAGGGHHGALVGMLFGAAISYVLGGIAGRLLDKGLQKAVFLLRNTPPGEIFASSIISTSGMLLGMVVGLPLAVIVRSGVTVLITAGLVWILASLGWRIGAVKGRQILEAAGLSRIVSPRSDSLQSNALLVDSSAVMDRLLLILGRSGLLPGGLVVPQFVLDHLRSVAEAPDPVSSRRARRGLEALEALREMNVPVHLGPDEVPEVDNLETKLLTVARRTGLRVGTCSTQVMDLAARWELIAVDLRDVAIGLAPDHLPGEHLVIELVKEGRQPRQAVGYLADGDMVVVSDAIHLIGTGPVGVTVLSTRPTTQGIMVFAKLDTGSSMVRGELTNRS
jgi:uncharacterized protein YacL